MDVDLRIVHGAPDAEELAAVMAVLTVLAHRRSTARTTAGGGAPDGGSRRAHWDRAWGGGFQPSGSWRERDRTVTAFDPGSR